jgi:hypothetical protein
VAEQVAVSPSDVVAIQQLVARYNHCVDRGDGDGFASCFTPEGVFEGGSRVLAGRTELATFGATVPNRRPGARHVCTDVLVDVTGDMASVEAYLQFWGRGADGSGRVLLASGVYSDSLVRVGGEWLFSRRVLTYD